MYQNKTRRAPTDSMIHKKLLDVTIIKALRVQLKFQLWIGMSECVCGVEGGRKIGGVGKFGGSSIECVMGRLSEVNNKPAGRVVAEPPARPWLGISSSHRTTILETFNDNLPTCKQPDSLFRYPCYKFRSDLVLE